MIPGVRIIPQGETVVMVSEVEGAFVLEPMRWIWPSEAKAIRKRERRGRA